ncbi:hypothetical protein BRETT_004132 [Brettanomyces bruxellensis]|uniref:Exosome complex component CSL4 C-terminal domain-containing protein n=1 Tax=Dekkera bruxellensis TaxID=5007 RepID=A0A871R8H4_DEKBR|nr:uncharacterized protein BRETT_004132 [Brettanomyces bruxellensis]QOU18911.1 hypothetical protein BRETT_004132 [Brettanomyces bruxellensis]
MSQPQAVLPGQPIVPIISAKKKAKYLAGRNCRIENITFNGSGVPSIVSSVVGKTSVTKKEPLETSKESDKSDSYDEYVVNVFSKHDPEYVLPEDGTSEFNYVPTLTSSTPKLNDLVLARVMKVSMDRVKVEIISIDADSEGSHVNAKELMLANFAANENNERFKGIIRSVDIRSTERDKVKTWQCFQPGDIIRAQVISLGDGINYYLSTAKNNLGVVLARPSGENTFAESGKLLYALDWQTMIVPETGDLEQRKCARPF